MLDLQTFANEPFLIALRQLFVSLRIPVNYISELPADPADILGDYYRPLHPAHALIQEVYALGVVDDAAFENPNLIGFENLSGLTADYDGILIFGVLLKSPSGGNRGQLADITRAFNRAFPHLPVVVVFRYGNFISIANAERLSYLQNWREGEKIGKVSLLKDIDIAQPHAGHLRILQDLAILRTGQKAINSFAALYNHWQNVLNVSVLNKRFFKDLANWYFWAVENATFPSADPTKTQEQTNQKATIRLITRLVFVWFLKEKGVVPPLMFDEEYTDNLLKSNTNAYYKAILQNLFFATLNRPADQRAFAENKGYHQNRNTHDVNSLYRYEGLFKDESPESIMAHFASIPFVNGGLFDCLDDKESKAFFDGFTRNPKHQPDLPNELFFGVETDNFSAKLNAIYGTVKQKYTVQGIINILHKYKFTVEENTPLEQEVALDPDLLGQIFESLLAYYNPETGATARKGTGSFYTPREIVDYMVQESLKAFLKTGLPEEPEEKLQQLVATHTLESPFEGTQNREVLHQIYTNLKILDPACGSGAFPMGILNALVNVVQKLDPDNAHFKALLVEQTRAQREEMLHDLRQDKQLIKHLSDEQIRQKVEEELDRKIQEIEAHFDASLKTDNYARKLYLIQNCIYGVDIQEIAVQITKLRFFLSLIVEQKPDASLPNHGLETLPNLEIKFVAANTLIGLDMPQEGVFATHDPTAEKREQLRHIREQYFNVTTRSAKNKLRDQDKKVRSEIAQIIQDTYVQKREEALQTLRAQVADWEQRLAEAQKLPKEIETVEVMTLFGEKQVTKIDKTKAKIDAIKQTLNGLKIDLQKRENHNETNQIIETAQRLAAWDIYDQNSSAPWFNPEWMFGITNGFDIVIGNPPYVTGAAVKESQKYFKTHYKTAQYQLDLYIFFMELGERLLNDRGVLSYITPNSWLKNLMMSECRLFMLNNFHLMSINPNIANAFEEAQVDTLILIAQKGKLSMETNHQVNIWAFQNQIPITKNYVPQARFLSNDRFVLDVEADTEIAKLLDKIRSNSIKHYEICEITRGVNPYDKARGQSEEIIKSKAYHANYPKDETFVPEIRGRHVQRYNYQWDGKFYISYGPWLAAPREERFFRGERIVFREILGEKHFVCTYITEELKTDRSLYISIPKHESGFGMKYIQSVLASRLLGWFFRHEKNEFDDLFPKIRVEEFKNLPIALATPAQQSEIENLVERIIEGKKNGEDTSAWEAEIDASVYALYGLSAEEIAVVEGRG